MSNHRLFSFCSDFSTIHTSKRRGGKARSVQSPGNNSSRQPCSTVSRRKEASEPDRSSCFIKKRPPAKNFLPTPKRGGKKKLVNLFLKPTQTIHSTTPLQPSYTKHKIRLDSFPRLPTQPITQTFQNNTNTKQLHPLYDLWQLIPSFLPCRSSEAFNRNYDDIKVFWGLVCSFVQGFRRVWDGCMFVGVSLVVGLFVIRA